MKKSIIIEILLTLPLLLLILIPIGNRKKLVIFPSSHISVAPYSDQTDLLQNAETSIDSFSRDNDQVFFAYTLKKGYEFPYAGISFNDKNSSIWNFTDYDILEVTIESNSMEYVKLGFQSRAHTPFVQYENEIEINSELNTHAIPLEKFSVPFWWYGEKGVAPNSVDHSYDQEQVYGISIESSSYSQLDTPNYMTVTQIALMKNWNSFYWLGVVWAILIGSFTLFRRRKPTQRGVISYQQVTLEKSDEILFEQICEYIGSRYANAELAINILCSEFGVTPKKMAALFRKKFDCTFKQYLNSIRLREAHRLILEEKEQITQILLAVGFNSPSHFNRLFLKEFGISPTALRKQGKQK